MKRFALALAFVGMMAFSANASVVTGGMQLNVVEGTEAAVGNYATNDLLNGLIATELAGDLGWHPANPAATNGSLDPNGLPEFTDGASPFGGLSGLLNDFPTVGEPVKRLQYDLASAADITQINIVSGNFGKDGRVFHTYTVEFSSDNGANWTTPIYVQSHDSGTINAGTWEAVRSELTNPSGILASAVTNLRFDFYPVDNGGGQMRDPWGDIPDNGITESDLNPFTGTMDGLTWAFQSPLIWEIDVLPEPASLSLLALGGIAVLRRRR